MQEVILDEPYKFISPHRSVFWTAVCRPVLPWYLKKAHGIVDVEIRHADRLKESIRQKHGVLMLANHCRTSDPMTMGALYAATGSPLYSMASFHLFKQNKLQAMMMPRLGAFSILREGADRAALNFAIDNLTNAERPLVIFPEGTVSRANDRLLSFMEGPAFLARAAAKRRAKTDAGPVVIHPVALRYIFLDDVMAASEKILDEIETRLSWSKQSHLPILDRVRKLGSCLLAVKEVEYLGHAREGDVFDRAADLAERLLVPHEERWETGTSAKEDVVMRVKAIRTAILPELTSGKLTPEEKADRVDVLQQIYLAQQLLFYPRDYLTPDSPPEHLLETVERFEEDLTDVLRVHGRMKVIINIGEPIEVEAKRSGRKGEADPVMELARERMQTMIAEMAEEVAESRGERRTILAA
ncbi:1-acyl-sn-glycerol-3-phosphate acyltransferase [Calycomorphotria hydatis]|uniref:Acyltransferase n=1 Tax=Calycomorphotria hydatis TaxID=2528027 RepID=A0A517TD28_9PLAN|nr:1-acyl-sn-glycerol-3-phosphate acyltransferase [Calycomorphotria hydatis]QDT66266.1 Acyltransferase [Calycomorphotria hydatis]